MERAAPLSDLAGTRSVAHHQGFAQDVGLQLEFIEPVLDHVPDAYEASRLAALDHGQMAHP